MKKFRLMTPGPTQVPEKVYAKLVEPIPHHRTTIFEQEFKTFREQLKWLFQTEQDVLVLSASGTGAMEASMTNLFSAGDEVIVINCGKFAQRWTDMAQAFGLKVQEIACEPGGAIELSVLENTLTQNKNAKAVFFQASETSTGAHFPVEGITKLCRKFNVLSVCDGISAVGIFDLPMDAWGIDVLMAGSQKAIMIPPGLAFIALSARAWKAAEKATLPKFYFNLSRERDSQEKLQSVWTPGISLIQAGVVALKMMQEKGLKEIFLHHEQLGVATRAAVAALGLELFSKTNSPALTAVKVPGPGIPKQMQNEYGIVIADGQDELKGKIIRIAHFGYVDIFDVVSCISALELTLADLGFGNKIGLGGSAALKAYHDRSKSP